MANLKDIRDRIKSVKSIEQVTNAMKMVAAAKMRRAQENMEKARPYSSRLAEMLESLIPEIDRSLMPELNVRPVERTMFMVITADRGMAGAFNHNVLREAHQGIDAVGKENADIYCIGKKACGYFKNRNYPITLEFRDFWNELGYEHAMNIGVEIVSRFVNHLTRATLIDLLPFSSIFKVLLRVSRSFGIPNLLSPERILAPIQICFFKLQDLSYKPS